MSLEDDARQAIHESRTEERKALRRRPRRAELRIDPAKPLEHPRRFVCLVVAAAFLEVDVKTLNKLLDGQLLPWTDFGRRRKVAVVDLVTFLKRQRKAG